MNLGNGFIPRVTWKTHSCGVWIWLFQVFWWTPVNIWDQPKAHGSGVRCPVLFWSSPSTFQEEAGGKSTHETDNESFPNNKCQVHEVATKDASTRSKVGYVGWCLATFISCPRDEGWYIFGSKVLCFLLGEETDSSIREFHWLSFSYFFWPFDRLKPTIPSKLSEIFLYWHNVESENVWFVFEQLFSEANIKEAQRCARCMLLVLSYISRKEVQVVGNRRFQLGAGWQPNLHIVLELKVWRSWVGTMHRRCETVMLEKWTVPGVETCKFIMGHHGKKHVNQQSKKKRWNFWKKWLETFNN